MRMPRPSRHRPLLPVNRPFPEVAPSPRGAAGFSLIEILCVLVMLGILVAISAPRIDFRVHRLAAAAEATGSAILKAQRLAVQGQHNVVLAVDVEGARLRIHLDRDNDRRLDATEPVLQEPLGEGVRVGRGSAPALFAGEGPVTFTWKQEGWPAIVFFRNGSASEEGGLYLTTATGAEDGRDAVGTRAVRIDRATGRPAWYRYAPPAWTQEH